MCLMMLAPLLLGAGTEGRAREPERMILLVEPGRGLTATYYKQLLELAVAKAGLKGKLALEVRRPATHRRIVDLIMHSPEPYVGASGTNPRYESRMLAVRVPIYFGMGSGYRIMLIRENTQPLLDAVGDLDGLRAFSVGQGQGWSDVDILANAGLTVVEGPGYKNLFPMLMGGRFDLFSRGLFEVFLEYEEFRERYPKLAVERRLLVVYPFAIFFFVSKEQPELHRMLELGLGRAYASGEMQDLLLAQPALADALRRARLDGRVRIELPACGITPETIWAIRTHPFVFDAYEPAPGAE